MNLKMGTTTEMKMALYLANNEAGLGRNVMILVPDVSWSIGVPMVIEPADHRDNSQGSIHTRFANDHGGLKSVAIDTLILVAPDTSTWDTVGEALAHERLRTSLDPRVIKVGEKP